MKRIAYLFIAATLLIACGGNKNNYTINGTIAFDQIADGDSIVLTLVSNGARIKVDTTVLEGGAFAFEGVQDSTITALIEYGNNALAEFFLENGDIKMKLEKGVREITGTPNNDAYQAFYSEQMELVKQYNEIAISMRDTTLTEEQTAEKGKELEAVTDQFTEIVYAHAEKNLGNAAGLHIIRSNYMDMLSSDINRFDSLLKQIPEPQASSKTVADLKKMVDVKMKTAAGQKYIDFEMNTPEGNPIKLSDFVGKHKVVLIDFWASWCGPCRRAMPELKNTYNEFKDKGLEIVGVSLDGGDKGLESWKKAIAEDGLPWAQMSDIKGWDCEGAKLYGVRSIPALVLIDSEGTIIARDLHGEKLKEKLAEVLN